MTADERRQIQWCITECQALCARLEANNLPNLASKAAGIKGTLNSMLKPRSVTRPAGRGRPALAPS